MANSYRIGTLNVRGLNNKRKRRAVFGYLRKHKIDIACLQETYIKNDSICEVEGEWKGKVLYKQGTNRSKGLITLIEPTLSGNKTEVVKETDRTLIVKVSINDNIHTIVNCYAPNSSTEKIEFLNNLQQDIQAIQTDSLWLVGDFNIALCPTDNIAGRPHHRTERDTFQEMIAALDIHDIWRAKHPYTKEYTWSRPNPFIARRLDYIFSDAVSLTKTVASSVETIPHTDHKMVTTQVNLNTFQRGPGYWKFNSALLSEPEFVTEMSDFITSHFENYKNENPLTAWEMFKVYAKHRCQDYSKKRSRRNVTHKEQLLQQLKATENQLCVEPWNKDLHRKHLQIKKELELHDIHLAKGAQTRARAKWIEGEKNTKYFLRLEKARGTFNTISSTRSENKYTDDPTKILAETEPFMKNCIKEVYKKIPTEI